MFGLKSTLWKPNFSGLRVLTVLFFSYLLHPPMLPSVSGMHNLLWISAAGWVILRDCRQGGLCGKLKYTIFFTMWWVQEFVVFCVSWLQLQKSLPGVGISSKYKIAPSIGYRVHIASIAELSLRDKHLPERRIHSSVDICWGRLAPTVWSLIHTS